jgi:hypothetical protein
MSPACAFLFDQALRDGDPTLHPRWVAWLSSLGLDSNELLPDAAILVNRESNNFELHVSQVRRKEDGSHWVDEVLCALVSEPRVIPLGHLRVWPHPRGVPAYA